MIKFDYAVSLSIFLSVILLTGTMIPGFLMQGAFAQVVPDTDGDGIPDDVDPHNGPFDYLAVNSGGWSNGFTWYAGSSPGNIGPGVHVTINSGVAVTLTIEIENRGTITNQGTLTIQNSGGTGISSFGGGVVSNSGQLNVANSAGNGMRFGSSTPGTLINSGTITITNSGTQSGIVIGGPGSVTNTGTIILTNTAGTSIDSVGTFTNIPPGQVLQKCGATFVGISATNQCLISIVTDQDTQEGNTGDSPITFFTVSLLDSTHTMPITVKYRTADDVPPSATVNIDYVSMPLTTLEFGPGEDTKTVTVDFIGDGIVEPDETFRVVLSDPAGAVNAAISPTGFAVGTILNDDAVDILPDAIDDFATTNEDASVTTNVLTNDITGDAPFTITATHGATGTTTVNPDNTITYMPNPDQNGSDSYTYTITDADLDTDTATVSVIITSVDDVPDTVDDAATTGEDAFALVDVLSNDSGLGDGGITLAINAQATNGIASVGPGNSITYTPNPDFNGIDSFVYQISDADADIDTATVFVTITPVNDIPVAVDDSDVTSEQISVITNILSNDILGNNPVIGDQPIIVTVIGAAANGVAVPNPDNTITYTPNLDFFGTDSYEYTVTDANGDADVAQVTITVDPVNDAPVAVDDDYVIAEGATLVVGPPGILANDSDPDGDPLSALLVDDVSNGTLLLETTGNFAYTPDPNFNGVDTFTYRAYDDFSESDIVTVTITVTPVNDIPSANSGDMTTLEDTALAITLTGSDLDGDSLTFSVVAGPTHGTLGSITSATPTSATISYTPNPNYFGPDSFTFVANDGTADSSVAIISITVTPVNDAPTANDDTASILEDSMPVEIDVLSNDVDVDLFDTKTLVSVTQGATGGVAISGNFVLYSPTPNFAGIETFTYVMEDSAGAQSSAIVTVIIGAENDAPIASNDSYSIAEDSTLIVVAPGVLANDSDVDSPVLAAIPVMAPSHGTLTLNPDGAFTYTPNENYHDPDSFTYQANDSSLNSNVATVSITVNPVNDAPTADNDTAITAEDSSPILVDVLANDVDIDGDTLTITSVTDPANGIASTDGTTVSYAPDANYFGPDSFAYTISDGNGGLATATILVTVTMVNDPPSAIDDIIMTNEDTAETVNVLLNDTDEEGPVTISSVGMPSHGTAVQSGTDSITYTPSANYFGSDSFTYTIIDSEGAPATATISVTILSVNDIPTAIPDTYNTDEDQALVVAIPGILENDSDVETTTLTAVLVDNTLHGTLALSTDGSFTYTPNPNYFGSDSFTYRASDGEDTSNITTVTITIHSINDLPVAVDDTATTPQNTPVTIPVLGNDSDIEGVLSILSVESPTSGTASVNLDNTITYLPSLGFFGTDSFLYTITDGTDTDSATITVTVTESTVLFCGLPESSYNVINGSPGNDNLSGTNGADLIRGYGGDDKIKGKKGNDCLIGGDGADKIWGGDGHDTIHGDAGSDKLNGDKGDDTIYGGDGNDRLWGGKDNDKLFGEIGYDKIQGGDGNDTLEGGDHNDKIFGGKGNDTIDAGNGNDEVHANQGDDTISGGPGNDWLGAGKGNDVIDAGDGNDKLFGRDGDDTLHGQGHDDQIHGGPGNDTIDGGETPNPATDSDRCLGGPGTNSIVNCEVTRGGSDDSEEHGHDDYEGEDEEPES